MSDTNFVIDEQGNSRLMRPTELRNIDRFHPLRVSAQAYKIAANAVFKNFPNAVFTTIYLIHKSGRNKSDRTIEGAAMTLSVYSPRLFFLIEELHKEFPKFGELKVVDFETQTVTARMGPIYVGPSKDFKFKVVPGKDGKGDRLVYRGKRRVI